MSDYLCNDCLDTGWIEDREGKTVCACISETEPYQLLRVENEVLKKQRDTLRKGIEDAFDWANGRQWEWGARAEHTFDILERALRGEDK